MPVHFAYFSFILIQTLQWILYFSPNYRFVYNYLINVIALLSTMLLIKGDFFFECCFVIYESNSGYIGLNECLCYEQQTNEL